MPSDTPQDNKEKPRSRLEKLIELLKSWSGKKPDYDNLDFSKWNQSEEEYQKEQEEWLKKRKQEPADRKKDDLS